MASSGIHPWPQPSAPAQSPALPGSQTTGFWLRLFGLLMLLGCCCSSASYAQAGLQEPGTNSGLTTRNILFSAITQQQGLSQGAINAIAQDPHGFIWLGTQEGLNRYDGYETVVYGNQHDDPGSLSHDWVWSLYVDTAGDLWVGTDGGGLNRYDRESDSFTRFRHAPGDPHSLSSDRVRVVYQDSKGYYWIGTDGGGLNRLDTAGLHAADFDVVERGVEDALVLDEAVVRDDRNPGIERSPNRWLDGSGVLSQDDQRLGALRDKAFDIGELLLY